MQLVIDISKETYDYWKEHKYEYVLSEAIANGTPLPAGHGRLGDLDELEKRISNFVERDAHITDEYTVIRQRFIVDGIRQTIAIIETDGGDVNADSN